MVSCDICINNRLALHNTRLIAAYSKIDIRVMQLGIVIKHWAKQRQINEPYQGTLSSYAYILLVIHFLQTRNPPILPVLQQIIDPTSEGYRPVLVDNYDCYFYQKTELLKDFGSLNNESLGQLLFSFFAFYALEYDWENSVVSVRTGKFLRKEECLWNKKIDFVTMDRFLFAIEDPFEVTHNLGRLVDRSNLKIIQSEFLRAYKLLCKDYSLASVCKHY